MFGYARTLIAALAITLVFDLVHAHGQNQATLIDGKTLSGEIQSISSEGMVSIDGVDAPIDLDNLRKIEVAKVSSRPTSSKVAVELAGGGILNARVVTIQDEACKVVWGTDTELTLSIDAIRSIKFNSNLNDEGFDRALKNPLPNNDRVFAELEEGKTQAFPGLLVELSATQVAFSFRGKEQVLKRDKVFGIVLAQVVGGAARRLNASVQLRDGSVIPSNLKSLTDGKLTLSLVGNTQIDVPWDAVASIALRSTRLAYLSDLDAEETQASIVTLAHSWQRDKSVLGTPLILRDKDGNEQNFTKGIGVHSRSELVFEIAGEYDELTATIGIDAGTQGRGNCNFIVIGDRKQLFTQEVKGADALRQITIDVSGVKKLTLLVEPGADLDLADHANWCDARLIRKSKK